MPSKFLIPIIIDVHVVPFTRQCAPVHSTIQNLHAIAAIDAIEEKNDRKLEGKTKE